MKREGGAEEPFAARACSRRARTMRSCTAPELRSIIYPALAAAAEPFTRWAFQLEASGWAGLRGAGCSHHRWRRFLSSSEGVLAVVDGLHGAAGRSSDQPEAGEVHSENGAAQAETRSSSIPPVATADCAVVRERKHRPVVVVTETVAAAACDASSDNPHDRA
ncbi:hypothetical protein FKP32DRAFT_1593653 [Trametes sanguinea]|nr:hypothetical protein FKP32DRAFT_1593653 [Trametes sanguinea]